MTYCIKKISFFEVIPVNAHFSRICILMIIASTKCEENCHTNFLPKITWFCSGTDIYRVPEPERPKDSYARLDLTNCRNLILHKEDFVGWSGLGELELSYIPVERQRHNVSYDTFRELEVETPFEFVFRHSNLNDEDVWILPPETTFCIFDYNNYTRVDVSSAYSLQMLHAEYNNMKNVPKVYNPSTFYSFDFSYNPMDNLTAKDLAPFCHLFELKLIPTPESYLLTRSGQCQCEQLNLFIRTFELNGPLIKCTSQLSFWDYLRVSVWDYSQDCNLSLADLKEIRTKCGDGDRLPLPWESRPKWFLFLLILLGVLFSVLLLLLLCFALCKRFAKQRLVGDGCT